MLAQWFPAAGRLCLVLSLLSAATGIEAQNSTAPSATPVTYTVTVTTTDPTLGATNFQTDDATTDTTTDTTSYQDSVITTPGATSYQDGATSNTTPDATSYQDGATPNTTPDATSYQDGATPNTTPGTTSYQVGTTPDTTPSATSDQEGGTPNTTPGATSYQDDVTPNTTPGNTPGTTPSTTPFSTPVITPGTTPSTTTYSTPGPTPGTTTTCVCSSTPVTTGTTPPVATATTPTATSGTTPSTSPVTTPGTASGTTPGTTSYSTPYTTPGTIPGTTSYSTPYTTPDTTPSTTPSTTLYTATSTTPGAAPGTTFHSTGSSTPGTTTGTASATTPGTTPGTTPAATSDTTLGTTDFTQPGTTPPLTTVTETLTPGTTTKCICTTNPVTTGMTTGTTIAPTNETAFTTPGNTTGTPPDTTPGNTTGTPPDTTPGNTTGTPPDTTPGTTPVLTTDTTSETTSGTTPVTRTDTTSGATPETTPVTFTDTTSGTTPGTTPFTLTDTTSGTTPGTTPVTRTDTTSGTTPGTTSVTLTDTTSGTTPGTTSVTLTDTTSGTTPGTTPVTLTDTTSGATPGTTPITRTDTTSESTPVSTPGTTVVTTPNTTSETMPVKCSVGTFGEQLTSNCSSNTSVDYDTRCDFACNQGFTLNGTTPLTCEGSGMLSDSLPFCEDEENPSIKNCPNHVWNVTQPGEETGIVVWSPPTACDNSDMVTLTCNHRPGDSFPIGITKIYYTAVDAAGNEAEVCCFNVTIKDEEKPTIKNCPNHVWNVTQPGEETGIVVWSPPTANDNSGMVTLACSHRPGDSFPIGITKVNYTAVDAAGNTADVCCFNVTIKDEENPTIKNCPDDVSNVTQPGEETGVAVWSPPTANDNSGMVTLTCSHRPGDSFPIGITKVNYTAMDAAGNEADVCCFKVTMTVIDACQSDPCLNEGTCTEATGTYSCLCPDRFKGNRCQTLKEGCVYMPGGTSTHRTAPDCTLQIPHGSLLDCTCRTGYNLTNQKRCNDSVLMPLMLPERAPLCIDIDECEMSPCGQDAICVNTQGSYRCTCPPGYTGDGISCWDCDECNIGKFNIGTCEPHNCDVDADCTNTPGSYICTCRDGFSGNGFDCIELIYCPYGPEARDRDLLRYFSYYYSFVWWRVYLHTCFPVGYQRLYSHITFTSTGMIEFSNYYYYYFWIYRYWTPSLFHWYHQYYYFYNPAVAVFGAQVDLRIGNPHIYFQVYDGRAYPSTTTTNKLIEFRKKLQDACSQRSGISCPSFINSINYVIQITWENVQPPGSIPGLETNTYQAILFTDGRKSGILMNYQERSCRWNPYTKRIPARIGYNNKYNRLNRYPSNSFSNIFASYRPDLQTGNTGLQGRELYFLDANPSYYINPKQFCYDWYLKDRSTRPYIPMPRLQCPCSIWQAIFDRRFRVCDFENSYYRYIYGFHPFYWRYYACFQPRTPYYFGGGSGYRCSYYFGSLVRGYRFSRLTSHYQSVISFNGYFYYYRYLRWISDDVMPRYQCCSRSRSRRFCRYYELRRPRSHCFGYRFPWFAWFWGDPHIQTLDGTGYTFNGLGEYIMLEYNNTDGFVLQARTGRAFDNNSKPLDSNGTVFTGFAATQGITRVEFMLNDNRTQMSILVNRSEMVDIETLKSDGYNSTDDYFSLSYDEDMMSNTTSNTSDTNANDTVKITVQFSGLDLPESSFTVTFKPSKRGILDLSMSGPPDYGELGVGRGLLGYWNGNKSDDFQYRNGTFLLEPSDRNLTEKEIFDFGQSWMITSDESLFEYGSKNWIDYNFPNFVPPFLDELLTTSDQGLVEQARAACGDNRECLFDALAVDIEVGMDSMATAAERENEMTNLANFPPNITDVVETSDTSALAENNTLCVIVNVTYMFQVEATDPNDDTISFTLNGDVPEGASIDSNGLFTWTPIDTSNVTLEIEASDGTATSSVSFDVKVCHCANNGTCDFETEADGYDLNENHFAVVVCNCTPGWSGDHCTEDDDSCVDNPCFEGVLCIDDPPPATEPRCGPCPTNFTGDGVNCYDVDECFNSTFNDCGQICNNIIGSYSCSCNDGFTLALDQRACNDIDECMMNTHNCGNNTVCTNTDGSFSCDCVTGFKNSTLVDNTCEDIDECSEMNPCSTLAYCDNTEGSFTCTCSGGYIGDGRTCTDENECRDPTLNECHEQAMCVNEVGFYSCRCQAGWAGNGFNCSDVDECLNDIDSCSPVAVCTNVIGSYTCTCVDGYIGDGRDCADINECELQSDDCSQECINLEPGYRCDCREGFNLTADNRTCEVNPDAVCTRNPCREFTLCTFVNGETTCSCNQTGFELLLDNVTCADIDECSTNNLCETRCSNTEGGFYCSCDPGFNLDVNERNCTDINECDTTPCDSNADCNNTPGSFTCSCNPGYTGNGTYCENINECDISSPCATNADCQDIIGSYTCMCRTGYRGDPYLSCTNIDECSEMQGLCHVQGICTDTQGSYNCSCQPGYTGDGTVCTDINECDDTATFCGSNSDCTNTDGSAFCSCVTGFISSSGKNCADFDECSNNVDSCPDGMSTCNNIPGDYNCTCSDGYRNTSPKTCEDINECIVGTHTCNATAKEVCVNLIGDFRCDCIAMYSRENEICTAANTLSLCVRFDTIKGFMVSSFPDMIMSESTQADLAGDVFVLLNSSSLAGNVRGVSVYNYSIGAQNVKVTFRVDLPTSIAHNMTTLEAIFTAGLIPGSNRLEPDSVVSGEDLNECELFSDICRNGECINTEGSYSCTCNEGFENVAENCQDINECIVGTHNCQQVCTNMEGNFSCSCFEGFLQDPNNMTVCTDIDECSNGMHNCSLTDKRVCVNLPGSFRCDCIQGYADENGSCEDINECSTGGHNCSITGNEVCVNEIGSFRCECRDGFREVNETCVDIDECSNGSHNCSATDKRVCVNIPGSFRCDCMNGYNEDNNTCVDIDECSTSAHNCSANDSRVCTNLPGSFRCDCANGLTEINDICPVTASATLTVTLTSQNGQPLEYTAALANSSTPEFMKLASEICEVLVAWIVRESTELSMDNVMCEVISFRNGSVVANTRITASGEDTAAAQSSLQRVSEIGLNDGAVLSSGNTSFGVTDLTIAGPVTSCPNDTKLWRGACTAFRQVMLRLAITEVNGSPAFVTDELINQGSAAFSSFQRSVGNALIEYLGIPVTNVSVKITSVSNGSILTEVLMDVFGSDVEGATVLGRSVYNMAFTGLRNLNDSAGMSTYTVSYLLVAAVVSCDNYCMNNGTCQITGYDIRNCTCTTGFIGSTCENADCTNYCQNGGTCQIDGNGNRNCSCPSGYDGTTCENETATRPSTLSTGAIVGIALGCVAFVLILCCLILLFVQHKKKHAKVGHDEDETRSVSPTRPLNE